MTFRAMVREDFATVVSLWERTEGIGLNESDTEEQITLYLDRNPGCSLVATDDAGSIVGAVLCGHDGRRGYLHHLAVAPEHRGRGLGSQLIERCFTNLSAAGILKCNIFLYRDNEEGRAFWESTGWRVREDLVVVQRPLGGPVLRPGQLTQSDHRSPSRQTATTA